MGHAKHFAKRVQSVGQAEHARRKTVTLQPPCSHRDVIHLANCSQRKWAKINHPSLVFVNPFPLEGNFCQPTPPTVPPNDHPPQTSKIAWFYPPSQLLAPLFLNPVNIVASEGPHFYRSDPGFYNEPGVLHYLRKFVDCLAESLFLHQQGRKLSVNLGICRFSLLHSGPRNPMAPSPRAAYIAMNFAVTQMAPSHQCPANTCHGKDFLYQKWRSRSRCQNACLSSATPASRGRLALHW